MRLGKTRGSVYGIRRDLSCLRSVTLRYRYRKTNSIAYLYRGMPAGIRALANGNSTRDIELPIKYFLYVGLI